MQPGYMWTSSAAYFSLTAVSDLTAREPAGGAVTYRLLFDPDATGDGAGDPARGAPFAFVSSCKHNGRPTHGWENAMTPRVIPSDSLSSRGNA